MRLSNRTFSGERPKVLAWNLADNEAQLAIDCELHSGGIQPMLANRFEHKFEYEPLTVYRYDGQWLSWEKRVNVAQSPIGVYTKRIYWTGEGVPKQATVEEFLRGKSYRMGIPVPAAPLFISVGGSAYATGLDTISSLYVVSFVNKWGEEGDMSPPSEVFDYYETRTINIGNLGNVLDNRQALADYDSVVAMRVYRLYEGVSRFVTELPLDVNTYSENTNFTVLGESFPTTDHVPPPEDMEGLHVMANDIALGFVGRTVYVSVQGQLNAWPHSFPVQSDVVGISSFDNTAVILTKGYPEVATIYDPSSISPSILAEREPCVSRWSIVQAVQGVMYAAPSGLYYIGPSGGQMMTENYMDERDWQALKPETMHSAYRDGQYYAWHDAVGEEGRCLVFDTRESNAILRRLSASYLATHIKEGTEDLYVANGKLLELFQGGTDRIPYRWMSKEHGLGTPVAFTSARVISPEYSGTQYGKDQEKSVENYNKAIAESAYAMDARRNLGLAYGVGGAINQETFAGADFLPIPGAPGYFGAQDTGVAIADGANVPVQAPLETLSVSVMVMADSETMDVSVITDEEPYRLQYWDRARHWEYEIYGNKSVSQFDIAGSASEMHDGS